MYMHRERAKVRGGREIEREREREREMAESDGETRQGDPPSDETQDIEEDLRDLVEPVSSWGRLVPIDKQFPVVELQDGEFKICRENVGGDKRVSRVHCKIWRDPPGKVYIKNLSSNGTVVRGLLLQKNEDANLSSGDEIILGLNAPGFPIYIFQLLEESQRQNKKRTFETIKADTVADTDESGSDHKQQMVAAKNIDSFKCSICLSIWHDTVSVAPCLHSFCNSCFSDWYRQSKSQFGACSCPQCRVPVISVARNHTLCNLVEEILVNDPSLRRPREDIERMEKAAMIKSDFMKLADGESPISSTEGFMNGDTEADEEDPDIVICRQCENGDHTNELPTTSTFRCSPETNHLTCIACALPLPERPDIDVPQKCIACSRVFCDAYWLSENIPVGPIGCPTGLKLQSMHSREVFDIPSGAFQGNTIEQDITRRYIAEHRLTITNLVQEWSHKLDTGEIDRPTFTQTPLTSDSPLCDNCADFIVQHLFYKFRLSVPKSELPPDAAGRIDCWYGYRCRTQLHKESHARKLNHVCEPARQPT
ncbi:hypothetical protein O6H91_15G049000 [Diphasiastrum complanatum]|uniref:Uncharacterized protein n=1 Tax=Diphasiastrum complanatum TaxID=34168 RepID=A0ACC2BI32_DIPCM|nr:hypothetical protein O6H91_15G049000 [Diphasiastrum complanatum]